MIAAAGNYGRDHSQGTNGYATITSPGNDPHGITAGATNMHNTPYRLDDTVASYGSKGPTAGDYVVRPDLVAPMNISVLALSICTLATTYSSTLIPTSTYAYAWAQSKSWDGGSQPSTNHFKLGGTSMAAPAVSGAAALMLQKQPSLTPDQVKARLMKLLQNPCRPTARTVTHGPTPGECRPHLHSRCGLARHSRRAE